MNKIVTLTLAVAVTAVLLAEPVTAQYDDQNIVVTPSVSRTDFVETVSADLDYQLERAAQYPFVPTGEGITKVRFTVASDGNPENVTIYSRSGYRTLDRVARRAVNRLQTLDRAPADLAPDQVYQANIIFAKNAQRVEELREQLMEEEATRIASNPTERLVFAFGSAAARPSS